MHQVSYDINQTAWSPLAFPTNVPFSQGHDYYNTGRGYPSTEVRGSGMQYNQYETQRNEQRGFGGHTGIFNMIFFIIIMLN